VQLLFEKKSTLTSPRQYPLPGQVTVTVAGVNVFGLLLLVPIQLFVVLHWSTMTTFEHPSHGLTLSRVTVMLPLIEQDEPPEQLVLSATFRLTSGELPLTQSTLLVHEPPRSVHEQVWKLDSAAQTSSTIATRITRIMCFMTLRPSFS